MSCRTELTSLGKMKNLTKWGDNMTHVEFWLSDDGKQFDNEYDCMEYEVLLKIRESTLCFFDKEMNKLPTKELGDLSYLDMADSIIIRTEKDFDAFNTVFEYTGGCCCWEDINGIGIWKFGYIIPEDCENPNSYEEHFYNTCEKKYSVKWKDVYRYNGKEHARILTERK